MPHIRQVAVWRLEISANHFANEDGSVRNWIVIEEVLSLNRATTAERDA
jgi:hypothetical protein